MASFDMLYYLTERGLNETSALICLEGPDANTYLQGQFTQELNRPDGAVAYGLFLDQKGKVVADGHVLRLRSDQFWLISHSLPASKLRERLEAYLIADEVTIADLTEAWSSVGVWGEAAAGAVAKLISATPVVGIWGEGRRIRAFRGRRSAGDNFELLVPREAMPGIVGELAALGAQESSLEEAERLRITSGIPVVPADLGPNDLPNEGGLDEVAISYTKGCYLGQEVMARLKNLGQVRRRLHLVQGKGAVPATGATLYQGGKKVGEVRTTAQDGDGFVAMAMISLINLNATGDLALAPDAPATLHLGRRV